MAEHIVYTKCSRNQWIFPALVQGTILNGVMTANALTKQRECKLFMKYEPGYSPVEHKELLRDERTRKIMWWTALGAAAGGAIGAAIIELLSKISTN